jgi:hypothetical protein
MNNTLTIIVIVLIVLTFLLVAGVITWDGA